MVTEQGTQTNPEPPTDLTKLTNQVQIVAKARKDKAYSSEALKELQDTFFQMHKESFDVAETHKARLEAAETLLRSLTIEAYKLTGNKAPVPGVGIREIKKVGYDAKEAYTWALDHKLCLKLDDKKFSDLAKDGDIDFVTITTELQATIASVLEV